MFRISIKCAAFSFRLSVVNDTQLPIVTLIYLVHRYIRMVIVKFVDYPFNVLSIYLVLTLLLGKLIHLNAKVSQPLLKC